MASTGSDDSADELRWQKALDVHISTDSEPV